jgi:hypothetical protein
MSCIAEIIIGFVTWDSSTLVNFLEYDCVFRIKHYNKEHSSFDSEVYSINVKPACPGYMISPLVYSEKYEIYEGRRK